MSKEYLSMFIDETREHLQVWSDGLMEMERAGDPSTIANVFRAAHTIKGMAMTMGFSQMSDITRHAEHLLEDLRQQRIAVSPAVISALLHALDMLEILVDAVADSGEEPPGLTMSQTLQELADALAPEPASAASPDASAAGFPAGGAFPGPETVAVLRAVIASGRLIYRIRLGFSEDCLMPMARFAQWLQRIDQDDVLYVHPDASVLEAGQYAGDITVLLASTEDRAIVESVLAEISELVVHSITDWTDAAPPDELAPPTPSLQETAAVDPSPDGDSHRPMNSQSEQRQQKRGSTVRVDTQKLDQLMSLVSELVIDKTRLERIQSDVGHLELSETVEHLSTLSGQLQELIMSTRLIPLQTVFSRFPRMMRDTSQQLGKVIDFVIEGEATELDRAVVEQIGDPIMHMLRNALDHGLELPEERTASGKLPTGRIVLRAFASGNHVFIEVEDDGKGLDLQRIAARAIDRGLVDRRAALSDQEIQQLLFAPGFTTADSVSDLSGRGVGLDVVKIKIESLSGKIDIHSELGKGARFTVRLPMTLAIMAGLLVRIGDNPYLIPVNSIAETAILTTTKAVNGLETVIWRGRVVHVIRARPLFAENGRGAERHIVFLTRGERVTGLVVDELLNQSEVVVKTLDNRLTAIPYFSGATILGDGEVALIIDPNAFVE
ncbi:MAG: chemotaxis protein CheW [Bacilli bacterium]